MSPHHRAIAAAYWPLKAGRAAARSLGIGSSSSLRVLNYHDIAPSDVARFEAQIRWLARSWNFVTPAEFAAMVSGAAPIRGRQLLLTFDDGFSSNRQVAERVLNPLGIRALFFIVSELVGMTDPDAARAFIAERICVGHRAVATPANWGSMGWEDIEALLEQGHMIGAHERTHARLSELATDAELEREIVSAAETLQVRLGVPIEHFSYCFGDIGSLSAAALAVARRRFRFIYSGIPGDNAGGVSPFGLRRGAAADQDAGMNYRVFDNTLLGAMLEGAADWRYRKARAQLDAWCRTTG